MKPAKARTVVESLIAKAKGKMTSVEIEALRTLLDAAQDEPARDAVSSAVENVDLDLSSLKAKPLKGVILCLDFGTAFSKAFATRGRDNELVELELGRIAGGEAGEFPVLSSVYIGSNKIWFGPGALGQSNIENDPSRQRFDSPKQWISQGSFEHLAGERVSIDINPTDIRLSQRDLILLYLAYLTELACAGLEEHGLSRYARRRFARPAWDDEISAWAEAEMKKMLAEAQILADTFGKQLMAGIPVTTARVALDKVSHLQKLPDSLIAESVLEATAAGASALRHSGIGRRLFVVADIGAGTSDFAAFYVTQNPHGDTKVFEAAETRMVLRQAGDTLDRLLVETILASAGVGVLSPEGRRLAARIHRNARDLKLALFRDGFVDVVLANDDRVRIQRAEFLKSPNVKRFSRLLAEKFDSCLTSLPSETLKAFNYRAHVVLTGGGASLPMVDTLATRQVRTDGGVVRCTRSELVPEWVTDEYPSLSALFPQLAVAIGGASTELPQQMRSIQHFGGVGTEVRYIVPPIYKG